jgi:hypothetical protein
MQIDIPHSFNEGKKGHNKGKLTTEYQFKHCDWHSLEELQCLPPLLYAKSFTELWYTSSN